MLVVALVLEGVGFSAACILGVHAGLTQHLLCQPEADDDRLGRQVTTLVVAPMLAGAVLALVGTVIGCLGR